MAAWPSHKKHCEALNEIPVAFEFRVQAVDEDGQPVPPMPGHEDLYY